MPQTNIQNSQRTDCNNGECVQITTTCVDGDCTERRIVVDGPVDGNFESGPQRAGRAQRVGGLDTDSDSDSDSDDECGSYKKKTVAIIFSGLDVTIPSVILSLIMITIFMIGIFKMKKKK